MSKPRRHAVTTFDTGGEFSGTRNWRASKLKRDGDDAIAAGTDRVERSLRDGLNKLIYRSGRTSLVLTHQGRARNLAEIWTHLSP